MLRVCSVSILKKYEEKYQTYRVEAWSREPTGVDSRISDKLIIMSCFNVLLRTRLRRNPRCLLRTLPAWQRAFSFMPEGKKPLRGISGKIKKMSQGYFVEFPKTLIIMYYSYYCYEASLETKGVWYAITALFLCFSLSLSLCVCSLRIIIHGGWRWNRDKFLKENIECIFVLCFDGQYEEILLTLWRYSHGSLP